jgi:hypothetical protein
VVQLDVVGKRTRTETTPIGQANASRGGSLASQHIVFCVWRMEEGACQPKRTTKKGGASGVTNEPNVFASKLVVLGGGESDVVFEFVFEFVFELCLNLC